MMLSDEQYKKLQELKSKIVINKGTNTIYKNDITVSEHNHNIRYEIYNLLCNNIIGYEIIYEKAWGKYNNG